MKRRKLLLSLAVKLWCFEIHADAQCSTEQQDSCRLSVADQSLPSSGWCEAKEYVAFTHNCFRRFGHPVVDYCCCSHPRDGAVMCCRYVQAWNHYRCVESMDRINASSTTTELNLPVVLPSVFITLGVLLTCLLCCLVRCCFNSTEEGKQPSKFCRLCSRICNCGMMDDSDMKSQNCSPASVPRSETRVTNASFHHSDSANPEGVFCLCRPRHALSGVTVGAVGIGCQSPYPCQHSRGSGALVTSAWTLVPPGPTAPNLEEEPTEILPCLTQPLPSQQMYDVSDDVTQCYHIPTGEENDSCITTSHQQNGQELVTQCLLPPYDECSRDVTSLTINTCDVCSTRRARLTSSSDVPIAPPSYEECIATPDHVTRQHHLPLNNRPTDDIHDDDNDDDDN